MTAQVSYRPFGESLSAKMKQVGIAFAAMASPVAAQQVNCLMEDGTPVDFIIDPSQFIDAVSVEEPIRRKVTYVRMGDTSFPAEPFIIGNRRGFHAEGLGDSALMFVVGPDGVATSANAREGTSLVGQCEVG